MKCVIMAGGEGSRLRPLTCNIPKPMARLAGKPVIEYILDLLDRNGCDRAVMTLGYLPCEITDNFYSGKYKNIEVDFSVETEPLGTAGSVKKAAENFDRDFLVISGDCLCDFDLKKAYDFHMTAKPDITIVSTVADDPREYGIINVDQNGFVCGFSEKPSWQKVITNRINTGIYIVNPKVLDLIPVNSPFDFSKDLFPALLERGGKIAVFEAEGYWCDIGDLKSFRRCQFDIMSGRVRTDRAANPVDGCFGQKPAGNFVVLPPVYFGSKVSVEDGAIIGPDTVLDDGVRVEQNARIRSSVILQNAYIGRSARISGSIVCSGADVKSRATLFEDSVIGSGSVVGEDAIVMPSKSVWPHKKIADGVTVNSDVKFGDLREDLFAGGRLHGRVGADITPEFCTALGCAAGSLKQCENIAVAYDSSNVSKALAGAVMSGLLSTGCKVISFGRLIKSQMAFACSFCEADLGIYISFDKECFIDIFGSDGLRISGQTERNVVKCIEKGEFVRCAVSEYKTVTDMSGIKQIYLQELCRQAPDGLYGTRARVFCDNPETESLLNNVLNGLGCDTLEGTEYRVSADGCSLTVKNQFGESFSFQKLFALCCMDEFERGEAVAVDIEAPLFIDALAKKYGGKVLRMDFDKTPQNSPLREKAISQQFLRDGLMMTLKILDMEKKGKNVRRLLKSIPDYATVLNDMGIETSASAVMRILSEQYTVTPAGVEMDIRGSKVFIRPNSSGKKLCIRSESKNAETARSACDEVEERVRRLLDKTGKR